MKTHPSKDLRWCVYISKNFIFLPFQCNYRCKKKSFIEGRALIVSFFIRKMEEETHQKTTKRIITIIPKITETITYVRALLACLSASITSPASAAWLACYKKEQLFRRKIKYESSQTLNKKRSRARNIFNGLEVRKVP